MENVQAPQIPLLEKVRTYALGHKMIVAAIVIVVILLVIYYVRRRQRGPSRRRSRGGDDLDKLIARIGPAEVVRVDVDGGDDCGDNGDGGSDGGDSDAGSGDEGGDPNQDVGGNDE